MTSTSMSDPVLAAMAQADVLLLLASLFREPSRETAERLRFAAEQQDDLLINAGSRNRVAWCRHLATVARQLEPPGLSQVSASHNRLFDGRTYCPINETAYISRDKGAILASIAGFYRAFGFEPKPHAREKADDLVSELEFVAMLLVMMGNALEQDRKEDAETCREALRSFASDHLGEWLVPFCDRLEETADLAFHYSAAQLLSAAWARLSSCHDLATAEARHEPKPRFRFQNPLAAGMESAHHRSLLRLPAMRL
jgi:TorA maturation chaperone TorD